MSTLAVTSVSSLLCQTSICLRTGLKFRCMRSTPTEMQSMSENDFECLARTGVNTPETMFPYSEPTASALVGQLAEPLSPRAIEHLFNQVEVRSFFAVGVEWFANRLDGLFFSIHSHMRSFAQP